MRDDAAPATGAAPTNRARALCKQTRWSSICFGHTTIYCKSPDSTRYRGKLRILASEMHDMTPIHSTGGAEARYNKLLNTCEEGYNLCRHVLPNAKTHVNGFTQR